MGIKIGYRRAAGKIGISQNEKGKRGTWQEKRMGLFACLQGRGHNILPFSEPTKESQGLFKSVIGGRCDILFIEFGGTNLQFYGKDWAKTCDIIQSHTGPVVFLCDDPDLPFIWKMLPKENWSRWTILVNAINKGQAKEMLGVPVYASVKDYPFSVNQYAQKFSEEHNSRFVYIGRPNGRGPQVKLALDSGLVDIYGSQKEWEGIAQVAGEAPEQANRTSFYRQFSAALVMCDKKHVKTGWRTGRAYHALLAGIPVFNASDNPALNWAIPFNKESVADVGMTRKQSRESQFLRIQADQAIANQTLGELNL